MQSAEGEDLGEQIVSNWNIFEITAQSVAIETQMIALFKIFNKNIKKQVFLYLKCPDIQNTRKIFVLLCKFLNLNPHNILSLCTITVQHM